MQLISDDPRGWSVTEYLPARDSRTGKEKDRFTIQGLPPGNYHLYHHLIGTPKSYSLGGKEYPYTAPLDAWGGLPVKLEAGGAVQLKDFIDYSLADLAVRVSDASGRLIENATLRIRDRMSESWRQVEENPAQLEQAADPIPYPAAARIVRGVATLPRIREGMLELHVEIDNGPIYSFVSKVTPGQELTLTLPTGADQ
jgi:hypothetical protein